MSIPKTSAGSGKIYLGNNIISMGDCWRKPNEDTLLYMPFNNNYNDDSGKQVSIAQQGRQLTYGSTAGNQIYGIFTGSVMPDSSKTTKLTSGTLSDFTGSGNWTVNHRLNMDSKPSDQLSVVWGYGIYSNYKGVGIIINPDKTIVIFVYYGDINTGINIGNGRKCLGITHSNNLTKIYLNGQEVYSRTGNYTFSGGLCIGGDPNHYGNGMNGYMDEFIIEKKTWTKQNFLDYYNLTKSNYGY